MTLKEAKKYVTDFFKGDSKKILMWWNTRNPNLGNVTPNFLAIVRPEKFCQWVEDTKRDNGSQSAKGDI